MIIGHGKLLPNHSQWAEEMLVLDLSNHTERQLLSIYCSEKHQINSIFVFHLPRSRYPLCILLWYINMIRKFFIEHNQLISAENAQWRYFLLLDFIPESRITIVDNFLILFVTLLSGFHIVIHANNTTSLQNIKNPLIWRLEAIPSVNNVFKLQHLLFHLR